MEHKGEEAPVESPPGEREVAQAARRGAQRQDDTGSLTNLPQAQPPGMLVAALALLGITADDLLGDPSLEVKGNDDEALASRVRELLGDHIALHALTMRGGQVTGSHRMWAAVLSTGRSLILCAPCFRRSAHRARLPVSQP
jgi:hypothetical protein